MIIRKFNFCDKGPIIEKDGEFLHINDIELLLISERRIYKSSLDHENKIILSDDKVSNLTKQMIAVYKAKIELIDSLLNKIQK